MFAALAVGITGRVLPRLLKQQQHGWVAAQYAATAGRALSSCSAGGVDAGGAVDPDASQHLESLKVVILGQPNVGKSTLFNRFTTNSRLRNLKKTAIVHDTPGSHVTRDVIRGRGAIGDIHFTCYDTAGHNDAQDWLDEVPTLENSVTEIVQRTLHSSHVALLLVSARQGVLPIDHALAGWIRRHAPRAMLDERRVKVLINKCDGLFGQDHDGVIATAYADAFALGFGEPIPIAAASGEGMADLHSALVSCVPPSVSVEDAPSQTVKAAIMGRPNVGKSTLLNRLAGWDRVLTGPKPGLTRDAIEYECSWEGRSITLIDTAGRLRRSKLLRDDSLTAEIADKAGAEAERAVKLSHVVVLMLDAADMLPRVELLTHFEATLAAKAIEHGRPLVVVANKMDVALQSVSQRNFDRFVKNTLPKFTGTNVLAVSAKTGAGVEGVMPAVVAAYDKWTKRVPTSVMNQWLRDLKALYMAGGPATVVRRTRFVTQVASRPPAFAFFLNGRNKRLSSGQLSFFVRKIQKDFGLEGVPVRVSIRAGGTK